MSDYWYNGYEDEYILEGYEAEYYSHNMEVYGYDHANMRYRSHCVGCGTDMSQLPCVLGYDINLDRSIVYTRGVCPYCTDLPESHTVYEYPDGLMIVLKQYFLFKEIKMAYKQRLDRLIKPSLNKMINDRDAIDEIMKYIY